MIFKEFSGDKNCLRPKNVPLNLKITWRKEGIFSYGSLKRPNACNNIWFELYLDMGFPSSSSGISLNNCFISW